LANHFCYSQKEKVAVLRSEGFLRVKEAAALLGVSPNTVRAWGAEAKIPEYRHPVNNYRLYKVEELEQILHDLEESCSVEAKVVKKRRAK